MRNGSASKVLIEGLKRLEYRGYDSAGISVLNGSGIRTIRQPGKIKSLETVVSAQEIQGSTGVGPTRWATHGAPNEQNAHPHQDSNGDVVVVHNGIIENYLALRRDLAGQGVVFSSETDSEVIAHMIARNYQGDLVAAVRTVVATLEGSYALAVLHRGEPGLVVGTRRDSPLVLGVGEGANYLASDIPALLPLTRQVVPLEDGDVAAITPDGVSVTDAEGRPAEREAIRITWTAAQAEKGGYEHYMLKEIHEQPNTVGDCLLGRIASGDEEVVLEDLRIAEQDLKALERVELLACGTSWHAGLVARFYFERFAGLQADVDYASEFVYRDLPPAPHVLVVGISLSGETAAARAALRRARESWKSPVVVVCNVAGSSMAREADGLILTHAGPEIGVASTKAFMGQLTALLLLALRIGRVRGVIGPEEVREVASELRRLPHELERVLHTSDAVRALADRYKDCRDFLYIGRGINYPIALEGALKLKEISYIHAEGYPAGEMKHGPIALIDEGMPILAIATKGRTYATIAGNVAEAKARGGRILALVNEGDDQVASVADHVIRVPEVPDYLSPMINIVPLQFLAYWIARRRGTDVDQPRNLAKTVTVQ